MYNYISVEEQVAYKIEFSCFLNALLKERYNFFEISRCRATDTETF